MSESAVNITVDPATVNSIVTAQIQTAVASALKDQGPRLIEAVVNATLNLKVNDEGKADDYYSKTPFIEWASRQAVRDAVKEEIKLWIEEHKELLRAAIHKNLSASKTALVRQMSDKCVDAMSADWMFKFTVDASRKE